jgi:hypothetical protein
MKKQAYIQSAIMTTMWLVALLIAFPIHDYAELFALVLSVGGMAVASFNYILLLEKFRSGEVTLEDFLTRH